MSNCKDQEFNIFSDSFVTEVGNEVIVDPDVTGGIAFDTIVNNNTTTELKATSGKTILGINAAGSLVIALDSSSNTITITNPWNKTGDNLYFNTGNVGIGVSDPDQKLEVSGRIHISDEASGPVPPITGDGGYFYSVDGRPMWTSTATGQSDLLNNNVGTGTGGWTDDGSIVRLSAGNFRAGVGTLNPDAVLEVSGAGSTPSLLFNVRSNTTSSILAVYVPDTESQARVGFGTGTPNHYVEIKPDLTTSTIGTSFDKALSQGLALATGDGITKADFGPAISWYTYDSSIDVRNRTMAAIGVQAEETFDSGPDSGTSLIFYTHQKTTDSSNPWGRLRIADDGKVGIGYGTHGITPTALLHISGSVDGTVGHPDIFRVDTVASAAPSLFVTSSTGYVGIRTDSPTTPLSVIGTISSSAEISGSSFWANGVYLDPNAFVASGWTDDGSTVRLSTITDNVGIGTTSPGAKLEVSGASNSTVFLAQSPDSSAILHVSGSGFIGIGAYGGPVAKLQIAELGGAPQLQLRSLAGHYTDFYVDNYHNLLIKPTNTGSIRFQPTTDTTASFQVLDADGGTPILNVDAINERVGIGTVTPGVKLDVDGDVRVSGSNKLYFNDIGGESIRGDGTNLIIEANIFSASAATHKLAYAAGDVQLYFVSPTNTGIIRWVDSDDKFLFNNESRFIDDLTAEAITKASGSSARLEVTGSDNSTVFGVHSNTYSDIFSISGSGDILVGMFAGNSSQKLYFGDIGGEYIWNKNTSGQLVIASDDRIDFSAKNIYIGDNSATASMNFNATPNDGRFEWDGINDKFEFLNTVQISGSDSVSLLNIKSDSNALIFEISGSSSTTTHVSSSVAISASSFWADGVEIGSALGAAEDGSYADGLFTDFTTTTPVGTAVDRFNEVLLALAPSAAPVLDDIEGSGSSPVASGKLSFGAANNVGSFVNVTGIGGLPAVDVNGLYTAGTHTNGFRLGLFDGTITGSGDLNEDVVVDGVNYPANSFGNADKGELRLEINGVSFGAADVDLTDPTKGVGIPGAGSGTYLQNTTGSGFYDLSSTGSAHFSDSTELDIFQHRTGKWQVHPADQRLGWNYVRVNHYFDSTNHYTNYTEWVNDDDSAALAASSDTFNAFTPNSASYGVPVVDHLSGVKYFTGATGSYTANIGNAYKNVYSTTDVTIAGTNTTFPNFPMPTTANDEDKVLAIAVSGTSNQSAILDGTMTAIATITHPLKNNLATTERTISNILLYNYTDTSTVLSETFRRETYRLDSGTYANQSDAVSGNAWTSSTSLLTVDGLMFYNLALRSPLQGANSGNFSTLTNGPTSNVNYSSITGTRTFYRKFQNTSGGAKTGFDLTINGSGTIVASGGTLNTANIKVFIKLPNTSNSQTTGWMDLATAFSTGQTADDDGCLSGTFDSSLNATNTVTFGVVYTDDDDWVVVKIEADESWTGNISAMSVAWG